MKTLISLTCILLFLLTACCMTVKSDYAQTDTEKQDMPVDTVIEMLSETTTAEPITYYNVPLNHDLQAWIHQLCDLYCVDEKLVYAIISVESSYRSDAVNPQGNCFGLMQIHECNIEWLSEEIGEGNLLDPYYNVHCGIYFIAKLQDTYGKDTVGLLRHYSCTDGDYYINRVFMAMKNLKLEETK